MQVMWVIAVGSTDYNQTEIVQWYYLGVASIEYYQIKLFPCFYK
jgi:hypothetical protein